MSVDGPNVIVGFGQQVAVAAPKARNMKARGKREAQRNASPLVTTNNLNRALKVRNTNVNYSALSELHGHCARLPGATRLTLFGACPWLSYSAPLALDRGFHIPRLWRWTVAFIFRAFGAGPWLSYSAPSALDRGFHISRLWRSVPTFCAKPVDLTG